MSFIKDKFKFIHHTIKGSDVKEVIAIGEYLGKTVKGIAKCDPRDTFDVSVGEELAARRCNYKIAEKRVENATLKVEEAQKALSEAQTKLEKALSYQAHANKEYSEASTLLLDLTKELN